MDDWCSRLYEVNVEVSVGKVLDLTDPKIAEVWGYKPDIPQTGIDIGKAAKNAGYDVVRFNAEHGFGVNYVVYKNFEQILQPQMITPALKVWACLNIL